MATILKRISAAAFTVTAFTAIAPVQASAQSLRGPADVTDGDSLSVAGIRVRLFGIDAPELNQNCYENGAEVACGEMSKSQLESLIGDSEVTCHRKSTDPYGRMVAICQISGVDLGRAMVEAGWATAFRKYSQDYVPAELRARAAKSGLWQWNFQAPDDYRAAQQRREEPVQQARQQRRASSPSARRWEQGGQCVIKGNRSRRGPWIYHLPGMPYYDATRAEEYFCTEADAQAAGYRRAIVR